MPTREQDGRDRQEKHHKNVEQEEACLSNLDANPLIKGLLAAKIMEELGDEEEGEEILPATEDKGGTQGLTQTQEGYGHSQAQKPEQQTHPKIKQT